MQADAEREQEITRHLERHLGPVQQIWRDEVVQPVPVDVVHVAASETRPVHTLVTVGMSSVAMSVPANANAPSRLELMMILPRGWRFNVEAMREHEWNWPIEQLRRLARAPMARGSWLGWGSVVPNGDPPQPLASNTRLCGFVIVPSLHVPPAFYELRTRAADVTFYAAVPLYYEEMQLAHEKSAKLLFERLLDHEVRDLVDVKRRNVARKRFGFF